MEKVKHLWAEEKFTYFLVGLGSLGILLFYGKNVRYLNTVWELVDEYGYLANAAFLSHTDWSFISNMYYGYGYSIWLVPLFWIFSTGTRMIKGAILINTGFILLAFWIQIYLMSKICKHLSKNLIVVIAFILSFYPYLVGSDMKVLCECLLTLMIWVCGLLLYQALKTGKWYYYVLLAVAMVYTFFVHTRALIFCGVLILAIVFSFLQKKGGIKKVFQFILPIGILFIVGFALKDLIIHQVNIGDGNDVTMVGNMLSLEYIWNRIRDAVTNFSIMHVYSFACKNFYLFAATAGMFHIGVFKAVKDAFREWRSKRELRPENVVKLMYSVAAVGMVVALIINAVGNVEKTGYFFYGRYYEYLIGPVVFLGLDYCMENELHRSGKIVLLAGFVLSGWFTLNLSKYLETPEFYFDSNRMASFAHIMNTKFTYDEVILYWFFFTLVLFLLIFGLNRMKRVRMVIPVVLGILFSLNNAVIVNNIIGIHQKNTDYFMVAAYVHENYDVNQVYFLRADEPYEVAFAGIQSLLGKEKLVLLNQTEDVEELSAGNVLVTFQNHPDLQELDEMAIRETQTNWFIIYSIE